MSVFARLRPFVVSAFSVWVLAFIFACGRPPRERYVEVGEVSFPSDLWRPSAVAVGAGGVVAVADTSEASAVHLFDPSGVLVGTVGRLGKEPGELFVPVDVAFDERGDLYVVEFGTHRISVFSSDGAFLQSFGADRLEKPLGIAVGASGRVYVVDAGSAGLSAFGHDGGLEGLWGARLGLAAPERVACSGGLVAVAEAGRGKVIVADEEGELVYELVPPGAPVPRPADVDWGPDGELFVLTRRRVSDMGALDNAVYVFRDGELVEKFNIDLPSPGALAVGSGGEVLVADSSAHAVKVYKKTASAT